MSQNEQVSMLDELLIDEYLRYEKNLKIQESVLSKDYVHGYISKKTIKGRVYNYLQYKENGKIVSRYIKQGDISSLEEKLEQQNKIKKRIKQLKAGMRKIEKIIPKELIDEYR